MMRFVVRLLFVPTLLWNLLLSLFLKGRRRWNRVDEYLWIGGLPFASDAPVLRDLGIRAVVNTCEEYTGPQKAYEQNEIEQLRLPTIDFTAPSLEDIVRGISFIERQIAMKHAVYVHCKAGRGRSATLVLCWLIQSKSMTADEAQAELQLKRPQVVRNLHQRDVVKQFVASTRT